MSDALREAAYRQHMSRGARCTECALYRTSRPRGPVPAQLKSRARLVVIGEAPGNEEVGVGRPFIGPSGAVLDDALRSGGLERNDCTITNVIACQPDVEGGSMADYLDHIKRFPPKHADGTLKLDPIVACRGRLHQDIEDSGSKTLLAVGGRALEASATKYGLAYGKHTDSVAQTTVATILKQHGSPVVLPEPAADGVTTICTSLHPAFAMRGKKAYAPVIFNDLKRGAEIACAGGKVDWPKAARTYIFPTRAEVERVCRRMVAAKRPVAVDIETDGVNTRTCVIRCIGLGTKLVDGEHILVVPVLYMRGDEYWTPEDRVAVEGAVRQVLTECPLVFHNGPFDTAVLQNHGLMPVKIEPYRFDTMVADHDTDANDLPHDLGAVTRRYFPAPTWKQDADHKSSGSVREDLDLHTYNCLMAGTPVVCADGRTRLIENIVRQKWAGEVLSLSADGEIESRRILAWHKQRVPGQNWIQVRTSADRAASRGLIVTPDHEVYTQNGPTRADAVQVGDLLYRSETAFTPEQRQALLGTLLGDSSLVLSPTVRGGSHPATCALHGGHVTEDGLAQHKAASFPDHVLLGDEQPARPRLFRGKLRASRAFTPIRTRQLRQLGELWPLLYDADGTRRLRVSVLEQLGPIGLAWWFMDDGCRQNALHGDPAGKLELSAVTDTVCLAACRYLEDDVAAAVAWFRAKYGPVTAGADRVLRFGRRATRKLIADIAPYVAPGVRRKLPRGPDYGPLAPIPRTGTPSTSRVIAVGEYIPSTQTKSDRLRAETRFCVTVEENHNFFTSFGLVKNCDDVLATLRLFEVLDNRVANCGTQKQFETDMRLLPIAREMQQLGCVVDEHERGRLSALLQTQCSSLAHEFSRQSGTSFNLRSTAKMADWLFKTNKIQPPLNPQGYEWKEGENASTSTAAITKILSDETISDRVRASLEVLLEYRSYEKLRSTYVDGLRVEYDMPNLATVPAQGNLAARPELGRIHATWKVHVIPTGRWASSPNMQNYPARTRIGSLRKLIVAPPGHVIVGGDFEQIELRIFALLSGDQLLLEAFDKDMDPHSLNAATIMSKTGTDDDIMRLYKKYKGWKDHGTDDEKERVKYLRTIAKRFVYLECIAEGTPVLTDRGLVPIESVLVTDRVWDGVEWVTHEGLLRRGRRTVVEWDGVAATLDHKVWLRDGSTATMGEAVERRLRLAQTGAGNTPLSLWTVRDAEWRVVAPPKVFEAEVFDLLNAGPRRRFTAGGRLVSNCYGGEEDKLFAVMSTERDKKDGKLVFPTIKPTDTVEWHQRWHRKHPWTKRFQDQSARFVRQHGYVAGFGDDRKRFFPGGIDKKNAPLNHPIQSSAGWIMNRGILNLVDAIPFYSWSDYTGVCLQVHDYAAVYVPEERAAEAQKLLTEALETTWKGMKFPLDKPKATRDWADQ